LERKEEHLIDKSVSLGRHTLLLSVNRHGRVRRRADLGRARFEEFTVGGKHLRVTVLTETPWRALSDEQRAARLRDRA
jgi:hypothetical protein